MSRIYKPTTPRVVYMRHKYLHIPQHAELRQHHVGLFYWCAYWGHWDKVLKVEGRWVTVREVDLNGNPVAGKRPRTHCTGMDAAMFADRPFKITRD